VSWQTTLVQPVSTERPTAVQVACTWCPWRSVTIDASTERGQAQVRSLRLGHVCAMQDPEKAFADITAEYDCDGGLYSAVLEVQQHNPDDLPVIVGIKAWAQLNDEQRLAEFPHLLQAYVELLDIQRAEDLEGR
jgi:hypothetical protein